MVPAQLTKGRHLLRWDGLAAQTSGRGEKLAVAGAAGRALSARFTDEELKEVLGDSQHVAFWPEHDDRPPGGDVFESDLAVEVLAGDADAGGAADLDGCRVGAADALEEVGDRDAEGELVDARSAQSPETLKSLNPVDLSVPKLRNHRAVGEDAGR